MACEAPAAPEIDYGGEWTLCWHTAARFESGRPYCPVCVLAGPVIDRAAPSGHAGAPSGPSEEES